MFFCFDFSDGKITKKNPTRGIMQNFLRKKIKDLSKQNYNFEKKFNMGLFGFKKPVVKSEAQTKDGVPFGRYSDRNKSKKQYDHWDNSVKLFQEGKTLKALEQLLFYIRDDEMNNVQVNASETRVEFSITQGSKTFHGKAENGVIEAQGRIAGFTIPPVPVMRKMLALNYGLRYTWCGIKDHFLGIFFSTPFENASSWKIYSALRELALNIDKQDDLLVDEFESLQPLDTEAIISLPEHIVQHKYNYLKKWITSCLEEIKTSDALKYKGLNSYKLLALCLRIDYLLSPQGPLMDTLEKIIDMYFKKPANITDINTPIMSEFQSALDMPQEKVLKNFYQVKATFSIANPTSYKQVSDFIFEESKTRDYYLKNNEPQHIAVIYEYIAGYCMFYFGMIRPLTDLLHLYYMILHPDFFRDVCGSEALYNPQTGALNKGLIIRQIDEIVKKNRVMYPGFVFNHNKLQWDNLSNFSVSYFMEFDFLNLNN
jgi:hypothetical protein